MRKFKNSLIYYATIADCLFTHLHTHSLYMARLTCCMQLVAWGTTMALSWDTHCFCSPTSALYRIPATPGALPPVAGRSRTSPRWTYDCSPCRFLLSPFCGMRNAGGYLCLLAHYCGRGRRKAAAHALLLRAYIPYARPLRLPSLPHTYLLVPHATCTHSPYPPPTLVCGRRAARAPLSDIPATSALLRFSAY